jgi:hypothetical protein
VAWSLAVLVLADPLPLAAKAGLAAAIAVAATRAAGLDDPLSAGFVALACVSPSAYAGLRGGLAQLAGSVLGVAIAGLPVVAIPTLHGTVAALGASMALAVLACLRMRAPAATLVAGFSVLYVHLMPFPNAWVSAGERLGAVLVGVLAATLVNVAVSALDGDRIAARRTERVRREVARAMGECAACIRRDAPPPDTALAEGFVALAALRADLADAAHERLFPGAARASRGATHGLAQAAALEEAAHLAKECATVAHGGDLDPALRDALAAHLHAASTRLAAGAANAPPTNAYRPDFLAFAHWLTRLDRAVDVARGAG